MGWDGVVWDAMGSDRHAGTENCNLPSFCNEGAPTANHQPPASSSFNKIMANCLWGV